MTPDETGRLATEGERLKRAREIVAAAETALSIHPIDCTENCGLGPCDCSGVWRVRAWSIDMDALKEALRD